MTRTVGPLEALSPRRALVDGHRCQFLRLDWRFSGWGLLGLLALGIGWSWVWPCLRPSFAGFYRQPKEEKGRPSRADTGSLGVIGGRMGRV